MRLDKKKIDLYHYGQDNVVNKLTYMVSREVIWEPKYFGHLIIYSRTQQDMGPANLSYCPTDQAAEQLN